MPFEMFLKLAGIEGESSDAKHKGEIDVLAWSWGLSHEAGSPAGGGAGAGRVKIEHISIQKLVDLASPLLLAATAKGSHIRTDRSQIRDAAGFLGHQHEECPGNIGKSGGSERRGSAV